MRAKRISACVLGVMVAAGCGTVDRSDEAAGLKRRCPLHGEVLGTGRVAIVYERPREMREYEQARVMASKAFPYANSEAVRQRPEGKAAAYERVDFCSACRRAEAAWKREWLAGRR